MTLAPRAVLVHRRTEYEDLIAHHGTPAQAAFFLSSRGRSAEEVEQRHHRQAEALTRAAAAVPLDWRRTRVERADLARFLFEPEDVVVVIGQDGLVANVAKYLAGQPVIGVDADPGRGLGVLVRHGATALPALLPAAVGRGADRRIEERTMVEAVADDTQRLLALNEVYVGQPGHQTARYRLTADSAEAEPQASSGVLVSTGTGATGWGRSAWLERGGPLTLPAPGAPALAWFVREAWPSPTTATTRVHGLLDSAGSLRLTVESDHLVAFGDGIETDALNLTWGQSIRIGVAATRLRLLA
ncbi:inorganic polyphosphate kinase [Kitasatospora sp. MMS16-BH015]|uniref:NAD(+)/NADH kinase n=1 Tax=Kitasatospora sp. MMS16-BH015 TaxID=2018025 RepID=UPI000CA0E890|nr:NAD(+)/NADH kinase [Kitasatospora sp. MMS16-BH015]AUG81998.1 inorganic polyphosphate kinase [Kitasatospora sp. MMS16-BH015]